MAKNVEMTFSLGGKLAESFKSAFNAAGAYMTQFSKRTESFSKTAGNIKTFETLQKKLEGHQKALAGYQKRLKEIKFSGNTAEIQQLNTKIAESENAIARETTQMDALRNSLRSAGVDMNNLAGEHSRLTSAAERSARAQAAYQKACARVERDKQNLRWSNISGGLMSAAAYMAPFTGAIKQSMSFEKSMAQIRAISDMTDEQFTGLSSFVSDWAGKTMYGPEEVAQIAENLTRAGYGTDQIQDLLPSVLKGAMANGISTDQMSSILTDTLGVYGFGADKAQYVMDAMITAAKQSNQTIGDVFENIKQSGGMLKTAGSSFEEALAYTNIMSAIGYKGGEGGNAEKRILTQIESNAAAQKQLTALGVAWKDKNGNLRTLQSLMKAIGEKTKDMGTADKGETLKKIFGSYAIGPGAGFIDAVMRGDFDKYLEGIKNSAGAGDKAAGVINDTLFGDLATLGSTWTNLKKVIGDDLKDPTRAFVQGVTRAVSAVTKFVEAHPTLVKALAGISAALATVSAGTVLLKAGWAAIDLPFAILNKWRLGLKLVGDGSFIAGVKTKVFTAAQMVAAGAAKVWAAAQGILNGVLHACPILLIVAGIAAACAAVYALWKNWGKIDAYLSKFAAWRKLKEVASSAWKGIKDSCAAAWAGICETFSNPGAILDWLGGLGKKILDGLTSALAGIGGWIWDGLVSSWETTKKTFSDGWEAVKGYAKTFGDWLVTNGTPLWDGLVAGWNTSKQKLADGWAAVEKFATDFQTWLTNNGPAIWDGVVKGWETTKKILSEGWESVKGFVNDFKKWLTEIGGSIWEGLTAGWDMAKGALKSGFNFVGGMWNSAAGYADKMWNGVKSIVGFEPTGDAIVDQKTLAQQLNDITVLDTMSKTFAERVAAMTKEWQPFKDSLAEGFDKIFSVMTDLVTKITGEFVPAVQTATMEFRSMANVATSVATAANGGPAPSQAPKAVGSSYLGGRFAKGGILSGPQIILAGEAGAEAIIPLTNERYGLPLLQQAANAFGLNVVPPENSLQDLAGSLANVGGNAGTSNVTNAPISITINADGDAQGIAEKVRSTLEDLMRDIQSRDRRVAYA